MYRRIRGKMLFVVNWTRPELSYETSERSRCLSNPKLDYIVALLLLAVYLKHTMDAQLTYGRPKDLSMVNRLCAHAILGMLIARLPENLLLDLLFNPMVLLFNGNKSGQIRFSIQQHVLSMLQ